MSWPQRPGSAAPPERAPCPPPAAPRLQPTQPYGNQQTMYPNYQGAPPAAQPQQQYWQPPQQPYNQQYGQTYQQDYGNNANQLYQQPQYNQNYTTPGYANNQTGYQQAYYQNQAGQQIYPQAKPNTDAWEDNWGWGWDESAKQAQNAMSQNTAPVQPPPPQQVFSNANVLEESFASTNTWNWAMEDKKDNKESAVAPKQEPNVAEDHLAQRNSVVPEPPAQRSATAPSDQQASEEVRLGDRDVVKERMPNLALGKRFHLDNLTPQWSIESQMSQESSDGPQTHSEGTYRSDNQSRNSSKSSPGLNTDNSNFNYSQSGLDEYPQSSEWSKHSNDDSTLVDNAQGNSRRESHDELSNSLHEMSIDRREKPALDVPTAHKEARHVQENVAANLLPPSASPANFPPSSSPLLSAGNMPPAPPPTGNLPPPPSSSGILPPTNFPPSSSNTNPFKQAGPFSHKKATSTSPSIQSFPSPGSATNLAAPAAGNKVSQHRVPVGFGANLETTPDNSERPDQPQMAAFRPPPAAQPVPDNLEVAPRNDRNEYLQTAHLSGGDYGGNTDFSRNILPPPPPPGLRRMVVGQQEAEYGQNLNISGDEPPPGLARMVPGQQTEAEPGYGQPGDDYRDRHGDGRPMEGGGRPYRRADGQVTPDAYSQPPAGRGARHSAMDRMVPGEPSNDQYPQYQGATYGGGNEQRVVMGGDHDYPTDAGPSDIREQNVDGSDYSEQTPRNPPRSAIGARETNDITQDFPAAEEEQREITMEGENLQDLSVISSAELTFSREQTLDGADMNATDVGPDRRTDVSDSMEHAASSSRRQSLTRGHTSGDESDRDRAFKSSPRRDRDKHKSSRDRDRDRDKEGRYSRGDRKYERESERRSVRDEKRPERDRRERDKERDRRERDGSPDARRHRRSARSNRYETEDTDYYSDRERERRRYREGSYASKPPRPDDKARRDERERTRRLHTAERDRRYEDERYGRYRDIEPGRKYAPRHERDDEQRRRVVTFSSDAKTSVSPDGEALSSPSRAGSREALAAAPPATDDDLNDALLGDARRHRHRSRRHRDRERAREHDPYDPYAAYGAGVAVGVGVVPGVVSGADAYAVQRQQYQYYEHLRRADPAAYLQLYQQLTRTTRAQHAATYQQHGHREGAGYGSLGYEGERGSVHSGRSSANGGKGNDTYYAYRAAGAGGVAGAGSACSPRDATSLRTDLSDRELNTDASLNLQLDESTVRSERMTPFKYSTAHIKGSVCPRDVVVLRPSYPVDGRPATVHVLALAAALAHDPQVQELNAYPGPLVKGVTHKKSVIDYCLSRVRAASRAPARDHTGYVLLWELLALLLRQNGVVVGADIAELLMKNKREYELRTPSVKNNTLNDSRRGSSLSCREDEPRDLSPEQPSASTSDLTPQDELSSASATPWAGGGGGGGAEERAALDKLREYLTYGNRQDALECAMSHNLWGHALALSAYCERRARGAVAARFLAALPRADPLHTLYAHLQAKQPPAATCAADERWCDWRPHAAIMLANNSARPDQDMRTLTQLGDSLSSRGLLYSAQFCYLSAGVPLTAHPLAPLQPPNPTAPTPAPCPRLALLLADPRAATLPQLATNQAIFATEIYEYALSLNQDYVIKELQVYKLLLSCRLCDAGAYERALAYAEQAARAVTRAPAHYAPAFIAQLAILADRLKYHEPSLSADSPVPAPVLGEAGGAGAGGAGAGSGDSAEGSPRHQQWLHDVHALANTLATQASAGPGTPQLVTGAATGAATGAGAGVSSGAPAVEPQFYAPPAQPQYEWAEQPQQYHPPPPPEPEEPVDYSQYYPQQPEPQPQPEQYAYGEEWRAEDAGAAQAYADQYWRSELAQPEYAEAVAGAGAVAGVGAVAGAEEPPRPMITMPGASSKQLYNDYDDDRPPSADQTDRETDTPKSGKKPEKPRDEGKVRAGAGGGGGWLGGILTKLSLRPPNQMILPDDKNPTIVWDAEHKRWRNLDGDSDGPLAAPPPPPRDAHATMQAHAHANAQSAPVANAGAAAGVGAPPAAPVSNIFKMQKGRHIKKSYVDVFNPSGAPTRPLPPPAEVLGPSLPPAAAAPAYFVPAAHAQSGVYSTQQSPGEYHAGI